MTGKPRSRIIAFLGGSAGCFCVTILNMDRNSQRGEIVLVLEMLVVVFVIVGFLLAIKYGRNKPGDSATLYYPRTSGTVEFAQTKSAAPAPVFPKVAELKPIGRADSGFVPTTSQYVITYSDRGFWPSLVEIGAGKSHLVLFRNVSSYQMWIRADVPHYGGDAVFDQGGWVEKGGEYRLTLPAGPGSYTYGNYLNSRDKGRIIVR